MKQPKDILTDSTFRSFVGKIYEIQLVAGECYGPFYRVSEENLSRDDNVAERYKKSAKHSRTGLIKQWKGKSINPTKLDAFLKKNLETIEMDPKFSLLGEVKKFFPKSVHCFIENDYRKLSQGRWCGLTKPKNFQSAIELYRVGHLGTASRLFLYEIYLEVPTKLPKGILPSIFCGKVKGGTSFQLKLNNHAIEYVSKVRQIEEFGLNADGVKEAEKPSRKKEGKRKKLADLRWAHAETLETRSRLASFEEDWNAPGMEAYDEL